MEDLPLSRGMATTTADGNNRQRRGLCSTQRAMETIISHNMQPQLRNR